MRVSIHSIHTTERSSRHLCTASEDWLIRSYSINWNVQEWYSSAASQHHNAHFLLHSLPTQSQRPSHPKLRSHAKCLFLFVSVAAKMLLLRSMLRAASIPTSCVVWLFGTRREQRYLIASLCISVHPRYRSLASCRACCPKRHHPYQPALHQPLATKHPCRDGRPQSGQATLQACCGEMLSICTEFGARCQLFEKRGGAPPAAVKRATCHLTCS